MAWHGMAWHGMVWYGMVWYGMVWYGMVSMTWACIYCILYIVNLLTFDPPVILHLLLPTVMINFSRSLLLSTSRYLPYTNSENFVSLATIMTDSILLFK